MMNKDLVLSRNDLVIYLFHGVICCPTAEYGLNHVNSDLFRLKRILVDLNSDCLCVE